MAQPGVRTMARNFLRSFRCFSLRHQILYLPALTRVSSDQRIAQIASSASSSSSSRGPNVSARKILTLSSILLQDGLDFQELPLIVRRTDKSTFPYESHAYTGDNVRPASEEDEKFKSLLQNCASVQEVYNLLEVPADKVTGYSASFALQKICQLKAQNRDWDDLHSFIQTAVMNELYDMVIKEVTTLTNETLISMVRCYLHQDSFNHNCMVAVKEEIEKRIGDSVFSLVELCMLSDILQNSGNGNLELMNSIWVHIGNRYTDINESNVSRVCSSMPASHRYIMNLVGKQCEKFLWKLSAEDLSSLLTAMVILKTPLRDFLLNCGKWLWLNIHDVKEKELMQIITAFIFFRHSDVRFVLSLERYIPAKGLGISPDLLALVMEYCRVKRYLSPRIFDTAAEHFVHKSEQYKPVHISVVLRPFGHLNYLPKDSMDFLLQVESVLKNQFYNMSVPQLTELLCTFAFVGKVSSNFVNKVLTESFSSRVKSIPDSVQRDQVGLWLEMYQSAVMLERNARVKVPYVFKIKYTCPWRSTSKFIVVKQLQDCLELMLGTGEAPIVLDNRYSKKTVYPIDLLIHVNENREVLPTPVRDVGAKRLALLVLQPEHFCVNSHHLLGEFAMRNRHLKLLGYEVIEILADEFRKLSPRGNEKEKYLYQKLSQFIQFDHDRMHQLGIV